MSNPAAPSPSSPSSPSGRTIVIFCDGTWNSPEEEDFGLPTPTNVYKLYRACMDEAESQGAQVTWYQPGVGSNGSRLRKAFEGATGTGTGRAIMRGYHTIAAQRHGPQDRIVLIGFSRGAFVARSIAGMIQKVGLLKPEATREQVEQAYELYRTAANEGEAMARRASAQFVQLPVRVHAIGAWDTVGALGLSLWGWSFNFRPLWRNKFHRLSPNLITDHVFHALAVDEKRTSFMPVLWHLPEDKQSVPTGVAHAEHARRPLVEEVWFRGAHSDVGGGYGDTALSDIALSWMMDKLSSAGLLLRPHPPVLRPDPCGRIHLSERGPIGKAVPTWPRWFPLSTAREVASGLHPSPLGVLHDSVAEREALSHTVGLLDRPRRRLEVGETARVLVRAREHWEYTGVVLAPGAAYQLKARGAVAGLE
jgi:uncharacterized protein (DUF2235 family)